MHTPRYTLSPSYTLTTLHSTRCKLHTHNPAQGKLRPHTHTHTHTHTHKHTHISIQGLFLEKFRLFVQHICFLSLLSKARRPPTWRSLEKHLPSSVPGRGPPVHWTARGPVNEVRFRDLRGFVFEECAWVYGNGCVSECLLNAILVRRHWTVEKDV